MSWRRILLGAAAIAALTAAAWFLPLADWTTRLAVHARNTGVTGVMIFVAAYIISTVAVLPG
ncbi:MAG: hypothetical protein ABI603_10005, partial [Acidobacteriota bacterium]